MGIRVLNPETEQAVCSCENSFCALLRQFEGVPTPCSGMRQLLANSTGTSLITRRCAAGLEYVALALPGRKTPALWVESGQVFLAPPQLKDFARIKACFPDCQSRGALPDLKAAFFAIPVFTSERLKACTDLLQELVSGSAPLFVASRVCRGKSRPHPVEAAKQFIAHHIEQTLGLREIAAHAGLSTGYLCRAFKDACGLTIGEYITELRVERAKQLLAEEQNRAVDAAYAAGFQSVRQFNDVFKRRTGLTPSEYRRQAPSRVRCQNVTLASQA